MQHKKSTIISDGSDKPTSNKSKHYVSNPELHQEFLNWYEAIAKAEAEGREEPRCPEKIGMAFIQIATNLAKKANWLSNSKYKYEMVGDAIENCVRYAKNYDVTKTKNPFAYFTQTCYYAFLRRIRDEKKEDYVKHKSMINSIIFNELAEYVSEDDANMLETFDMNQDGVESFIKDFEEKHFGQKLDSDELGGLAGKTRKISGQTDPQNLGFL